MTHQLTTKDYLNVSLPILVGLPGFSQKALDVATRFLNLTTEELEALDDVIGGRQ